MRYLKNSLLEAELLSKDFSELLEPEKAKLWNHDFFQEREFIYPNFIQATINFIKQLNKIDVHNFYDCGRLLYQRKVIASNLIIYVDKYLSKTQIEIYKQACHNFNCILKKAKENFLVEKVNQGFDCFKIIDDLKKIPGKQTLALMFDNFIAKGKIVFLNDKKSDTNLRVKIENKTFSFSEIKAIFNFSNNKLVCIYYNDYLNYYEPCNTSEKILSKKMSK